MQYPSGRVGLKTQVEISFTLEMYFLISEQMRLLEFLN